MEANLDEDDEPAAISLAATGSSLLDAAGLRDAIIASARAHGFHRVGIIAVEPSKRMQLYRDWLAQGHHGEMAYLAAPEHLAGRADVRTVLSEARTIVVVALAYAKDAPVPLGGVRGVIARYARGTDYHMVLRDKLRYVTQDLARATSRPIVSRLCVDSAPVSERELAERGGLGFVAKNTMLIAPGLGSYVLLGELLLDAEVAPLEPASRPRDCGTCRRCLDACPTGAFADAYVLDARRCISYLTIEFDGIVPRELRSPIGNRIFGCDVCQEVCPYNTVAPDRHPPAPELALRDLDHAFPDLVALAHAPVNQLRRFAKRTALRRAPRRRLLRNVAIALGNSRDANALPALLRLLGHREMLVRAHAAWALAELATTVDLPRAEIIQVLECAAAIETDAAVTAEIANALSRLDDT